MQQEYCLAYTRHLRAEKCYLNKCCDWMKQVWLINSLLVTHNLVVYTYIV